MWFYLAFVAAFFNALMDLFVKISSGKINSTLGGTVLTFTAALTMLGVFIYYKSRGEVMNTSWIGISFSVLAGISVGIATFFIFKMFDTNANLSLAIPFMRICVIVFS